MSVTLRRERAVRLPPQVARLLGRVGRIAQDRGLCAYAVGGCVRDWLLGRTVTVDLDVAVEGRAADLARAVAEAIGGTLQEHPQFGTASVQRAARPRRIDFAMCRKETYARPAAYPKVAPGTLEEDLFRRDFTINAMALSLAPGRFGLVIDPFGGRRDLERRVLRVLHPRSFFDDPSRILRGIRFAHRFRCRFDEATARGLRRALAEGALGWLNAGRLQKELDRMAEEPNPGACFRELLRLLSAGGVQ